ncbi:26S proteasome non-ATPase regulatory subunit 1-like protein A-like [Gossypium australe]|uniref:26S proteasome non-ATPase regulatory subunit 1-like protein A-like n=1 Tax=Gossypium australe TaxID=47621 RepID=A0A5B6WUH2_9ROSI|nr:26S proteasome non-ATPase regulatory subunit 1-like protein A-like [Gossypium australe]
MNELFAKFVQKNPAAQHPPPSPKPQLIPVTPQGVELARPNKPPGLNNLEQILMMIPRERNFGLRTLSGYLMSFLAPRLSA